MDKSSNRLFYCYIGILCWLPIPLASKSYLAQDFFVVLASLLSCFCCYKYGGRKKILPIATHKAAPACFLFLLFLFWQVFQLLPLPFDIVSMLSPVRTHFLGTESLGIDQQIISLTLSFHPATTWHQLLLGVGYFELFVLTLVLVDTQNRLKKLLYTMLIMGLIESIYAALMTLSGIEKELWFNKTSHIGTATGTLVNRNHLANYLTICIAAGISLLLANRNVATSHTWRARVRSVFSWLLGSKGFIRLSIILMVIGLILTRSRMGTTAFFSSLTIAAFLWLALSRKLNKSTLILFASLIIIDLFIMGSWFGVSKTIDRIEKTNPDQESRNQMLPFMQTMAKDFWISGTGAGTFAETFPLYKQQLVMARYNEAHCDYLQFLIEDGAIGMTLLLLIVLLSLAKTIQTIHSRHSSLLVATGFSILMVFTAVAIHATVEYILQRPATASLFVIFLALPWVTAHMETEHGRNRKTHPPV